ncbi:hypothetical protein OEZ85_001893 [Tetradesmus obliquus]|uniref:Armadillo repeat-containing domain-containing protein n=1 Tax=Tetradesmus obliquus TaxID=3088 RepID=A0ABY8U1X3_TETOB|nr:hypothetical protein OEZ85_001893 [Tetradesmus obliquus]
MWRASTSNKGKKQQQQQQTNGLLSLSLLGNATSAWHSNVANTHHQQQSWTPRTGRTGATTGSASCSGRDDTALHELLSQHEQILQALGGRVVELQDKLEQLHEDVGPALRLVAAVREAAIKQQLQDTGNRDQELPDTAQQQQEDQQQLPGSVLGRDQAAARGLKYDRDDCGSVQSFATSISFASTTVSGPALMWQDVAAARAAAFVLNNCAHEASFRFAMLEAGAVPCLVEMLSGCDALGQEAAAAALMNLASEERNIRSAIVACNGIQALVVVLKYGGPAAQEAAAAAIENLSLDSDCEAALAAEGAIDGLLQVLKDGSTAAQAAAAGALRNLAVNEELEEQLLAAGCVAVLLQLAARPQEDVGVRTAALEGLRNLAASSTRTGDALVQAGGAAVVVDAARSLPAAAARSAALGTLLVLSMDATHRQAITAAGAASVLVHAALSGSLLAKEYAARSLANLAATEAARAELLSEGAATVLAALLKSQLSQLTGGKAAGAAAEQGGVAASASCVLAASRALQNLSKSKLGCRLLLDAGCIAPLAAALELPGATATAAASALCSLCSSRRALQELADCSGCSRLVAAAAQPKWLTPRGQRNAVRLLRRLVRAVGSCRADVQEQLAAAGLKLHLV